MRIKKNKTPDKPTQAQLIRAEAWGWVYCGDGYFIRENKITGEDTVGYFTNRIWRVK
jgi:hypothetical protein